MAYQVLDNTPSLGYIAWSGVHIVYKGVDYAVADGNTNKKYVWWDYTYPTLFQTGDMLPALTDDDVLVFFNKNGTHLTVPKATVVDGGLIVSESILADALAANSVTGVKILAGSISADKIAAGAVGAEKIAAGSIASEHIAAAGITADKITSGRLLAGLVEVVSQDGLARFLGDGFRVYSNNGELRAHLGYYESLGTQTATFTRSSIAYLSTGTQVAANAPRFEQGKFGQAVMVEEGTENKLKTVGGADVTCTSTTGWAYNSPYGTLTVVDDPTCLGGKCLVYEDTDGDTVKNRWDGFWPAANPRSVGPVRPGGAISLSIRYKTENVTAGQVAVWGHWYGYNSAGNLIYEVPMDWIIGPSDGVWQKKTITLTTPSSTSYPNAVSWKWGLYKPGFTKTNLGARIYVDWVQAEAKPYATSFIDGTRSPETLTIPTAGVLNPAGPYTLEAYSQKTVRDIPPFAFFKDWNNYARFGYRSNYDKYELRLVKNGTTAFARYSSTLGLSGFVQSTLVFTGTKYIGYANGQKVCEVTSSEQIGADWAFTPGSLGNYCLNGLIDDLRISSRARTDAEIAAAYNSNAPLPVDEWTTYKMACDGNLCPSVREDYGLMINKGKIEADVIVAGQYASKLGKTPATVIVADGSTTQDVKRADFVVPVGSTNAQDTINQAINSLPAGGGKVILLEGTYIVDGSVIVPSYVTLSGQGTNTVIKIKDGLNYNTSAIRANSSTRIIISDLAIDGNKIAQTAGFQVGVSLTSVTYSSVRNVSVNNFRDQGISITWGSNNTIIGNMCQGNTSNGIGLSSTSNNTVTGNVCQGNGLCGISAAYSPNNTITGNSCQQNSYHGIELYGSSNTTNTVTGNVCQGNNQNGIYVSGSNNTLTSNTCQGNGQHGILFDFGSNNTIIGNVCSENSQAANNTYDNIQITNNADYNNVQCNICRQGALTNKPRYGIRINSSDCNGNFVSNNDLRTSGVTAAYSDAGTGTITSAGNLIS